MRWNFRRSGINVPKADTLHNEVTKMMRKSWLIVMAAVCLLAGCGRKNAGTGSGEEDYREDVSPQAMVKAVADELGDEYWPDAELTPELLDDWYGISGDMYEDYYGETPMISTNVDTLIIVKTADGQKEDVENALDTYREAMVQDTFQYPVNIPKIQASQIRTYGSYVCFVQLGGSMSGEEDNEEAAIAACQEMNEQALSVIERELTK